LLSGTAPAYSAGLECEENSSFAFKDEIECTHGNPEGWKVWVERTSMQAGEGTFCFENETGHSAFRVHVIVNFMDYFGKFLDRVEKKKSPVHNEQRIKLKGAIPPKTDKFTCEVYWKEKDVISVEDERD